MSFKSISSYLMTGLALVVFVSVGCENPSNGKSGKDAEGHNHDHDHDHAHDHPAHGPNGGHMVPLETEEFTAEWKKYGDNNLTRVYILNGKNPHPVKVDSFMITSQVGDDGEGFELKAENPDENGLAAVYMLDDADLKVAIPLGVNIEIKMGDKTIKGEIKAHAPLDH